MDSDRTNQTGQSVERQPGQTVSHYTITDRLGQGGMGIVWRARDARLNRYAALKFLPPARLADPESRRRFVHEAQNASALNHPNIVTIYEIGSEADADFIAMELVPGKPLNELLRRKGMPLQKALDFAIQLADALAAAHAVGIVHRDVKPGNVMVTESGRLKVLDFGLAKLAETRAPSEALLTRAVDESEATGAGTILGTPAYMSPEQAEGKPLDARTDIFSFGALLYELVTGRRAFEGDSAASVISAILRDKPKSVREITPGLPRDLERILDRCLRKDPSRRYQDAGDLKLDLEQLRDDLLSGVPSSRGAGWTARHRTWLWAALGCAVLAGSVIAWRGFRGTPSAPLVERITRITNSSGLSRFPALSPDGKLIAYSADSGASGGHDLYVRQIGGGQAVRLTSDGAANIMPDFSPDGTKIVFRSNRNGPGIYEIPAFGGEVRLIVRDGLYPKYSPDGSQIAYSIGSENVSVSVPGSGTVWVVPVAGGEPRQVGRQFTGARYPVWSHDGKHLLCIGYTASKAYQGANEDWWLVPLDGGDPVKTGAYELMIRAGLRERGAVIATGPRPACWAPDNQVVFSMPAGDATSLWEIGVSPRTGLAVGQLRRLTTGGGNETDASCAAGGALAFASPSFVQNIWILPYNLDRGRVSGEIRRITESPANRQYVSLSSDGRYLAFTSNQAGQDNIWTRDLETGKETRVTSGTFRQNWATISPSGARIAYSSIEKDDRRLIYVITPGGVPEKLCEGCLRATGWSHDEKAVVNFGGNPYHINLLDLASHKETLLIKPSANNLLYGRLSPDDRWISFTVRLAPNRGRIMVAGVTGPLPVPESLWIPIADVDIDDWASWSPDGNTLYFSSARDGYSCFWGQRLEPNSRRPLGAPFAVQHLHGSLSYGRRGWAAGGNRIAIVLSETRGDIWLMSRSAAQ